MPPHSRFQGECTTESWWVSQTAHRSINSKFKAILYLDEIPELKRKSESCLPPISEPSPSTEPPPPTSAPCTELSVNSARKPPFEIFRFYISQSGHLSSTAASCLSSSLVRILSCAIQGVAALQAVHHLVRKGP